MIPIFIIVGQLVTLCLYIYVFAEKRRVEKLYNELWDQMQEWAKKDQQVINVLKNRIVELEKENAELRGSQA